MITKLCVSAPSFLVSPHHSLETPISPWSKRSPAVQANGCIRPHTRSLYHRTSGSTPHSCALDTALGLQRAITFASPLLGMLCATPSRQSNQQHTNANNPHHAAPAGPWQVGSLQVLAGCLASSVQRHSRRRVGSLQAYLRPTDTAWPTNCASSPVLGLPPPAPLFYFNLPSPPRLLTGTIHPPRTRTSRVSLHR